MKQESEAPDFKNITAKELQELVEVYDAGRCMFLAIALHRAFKYEIQMHIAKDDIGEYIDHAWAVRPDGMCIDIHGLHPQEQCWSNCVNGGRRFNNVDEATLKAYLCGDKDKIEDEYESRVQEALAVVRDHLLPTYKFRKSFTHLGPHIP